MVTIERSTQRYRRSINGAWMYASREVETFTVHEAELARFSIGSGLKVTWPDGVTECAFPFNGGAFPGYAPTLIPTSGRLAAIFDAA